MIEFSIVYALIAVPMAATGTTPCERLARHRTFAGSYRYLMWGLVSFWLLGLTLGAPL